MANEWLRYANQGATRNQPLSSDLATALGKVLPELGVSMEVFSGGQPGKGSGLPRVGSVRHDHGDSADVFFMKDGRRLDWANRQDLPIFQDIVRQSKAAGVTGFGAGPGYMQPGSMHIGFGHPGVWGAGGSGKNAPGWLVEAFNGASAPAARPAPSGLAEPFVQPSGVPVPTPTAISPLAPQAMAMVAGNNNPGAAPPAGGDPGGMMFGNIASMFLQNQQAQLQRRKDEQDAEQARRVALFGGGIGGLYG